MKQHADEEEQAVLSALKKKYSKPLDDENGSGDTRASLCTEATHDTTKTNNSVRSVTSEDVKENYKNLKLDNAQKTAENDD